MNHLPMILKPECRGKAGGAGELPCAVLPARGVIPGMIAIHCRTNEFLVTAGAVMAVQFGAKLHG